MACLTYSFCGFHLVHVYSNGRHPSAKMAMQRAVNRPIAPMSSQQHLRNQCESALSGHIRRYSSTIEVLVVASSIT